MGNAAQPREESFARLDAYVAAGMGPAGDPGAVLVVVDDAGVVHCRGFGHDTRGNAITCRTPFAVASLTKGLTALGVVRAAELGHIALDAPVRASLETFRTADPVPITVMQALQMRTGISTSEGKRWLASTDAGSDALERRVRELDGIRLFAPPGTTFAYSNADYDVLGALLQHATGKPYATYMRDEVLLPLGIAAARIGRDPSLRGYTRVFGVPVPAPRAPRDRADDPAAGLVVGAMEYGRYLSAQVDEGRSWSGAILSRAGWLRLHASPDGSPYAMGWFDVVRRGSHVYRHDGLAPDFHAFAVFSPEHRIGAALFVNASEEPDGDRRTRFDLGLQRLIFGGTPDPQPVIPADVPIRILVLTATVTCVLGIRGALRSSGRCALVRGGIAASVLAALWLLVLPLMGGSLLVGIAYAPDLGALITIAMISCALTTAIALARAVRSNGPRRGP